MFEFITKCRNDIHVIHKGGKYLREHGIKIADNVINPIPGRFVNDLENITEAQLLLLSEEILANKIDVESRFITILFDMCLFSGYHFSAMSSGKEPSAFCNYIMASICRMFGQINHDLFINIFTEGYKTDDCENYVRNCFYNLLAFELEKGIPFIERSKSVTEDEEFPDIDEWLPLEGYSDDTIKLNNRMKKKTSTAYLQRLAVTYWKANNDPELKKHIQKLGEVFGEKIRFNALQDYYFDTLTNIMTKGGALWKNDLLDAIILCNIQDQHVLITYDNDVIDRMERRKNEYPKYKTSVEVIGALKE